ncbi:hypothetical protein RBSWK_01033 [Rhodopirellula baltica SWK14]|uniref:Uncharacterized protein n=1 Tax=Rhodopirellula baltica SWK14 TaxID=993516 RepID=L7CM53_RHOBT|nr:hypothetical protein RBSWK_01033 [Rhodopirellula baltica SWK14]
MFDIPRPYKIAKTIDPMTVQSQRFRLDFRFAFISTDVRALN